MSAGSYPGTDLLGRADRIREWALAGRDVFVYFSTMVTPTQSATRGPSGAPGPLI